MCRKRSALQAEINTIVFNRMRRENRMSAIAHSAKEFTLKTTKTNKNACACEMGTVHRTVEFHVPSISDEKNWCYNIAHSVREHFQTF